jgi:hypothetical protein
MVDGPTFNEGEHYHRKIYEPNKLNGSGKNQDEAPEPDPRAFARKLVYPNEFDQVLRLDWLVKEGIAAGGGEENSAKDQNIAWGNLRLVHEALARYHTIHIGAAGHTGKDESRGARGSNASYGDNDVSLQIGIGDTGIKEVSINKANELPEGPLMRFKMEPFNTGLVDQDGDPIEVWIAGKDIIGPKSHDADPKLTKNQQTMYSILRDAEQAGLSTNEWSQRVRDAGIGTNRKADIYDARRVLKAKCLVREFNGRWNASI